MDTSLIKNFPLLLLDLAPWLVLQVAPAACNRQGWQSARRAENPQQEVLLEFIHLYMPKSGVMRTLTEGYKMHCDEGCRHHLQRVGHFLSLSGKLVSRGCPIGNA